jgi:type VI secretion system protein VasD
MRGIMRNHVHSRPGWLGLIVAVALLAGCASGPPAPARIKAEIAATSAVNPDRRGRASPLVIKFYELKTRTAFDGADFFSLFERERDTLATELLAVEEIQLAPGDKRVIERTLQPATRFVGVVAAFREIDRAQWRATIAVTPAKLNTLTIALDGTRATITSK